MSKLRQQFIDDLSLRNYSQRTVDEYKGHLIRLSQYYKCSPKILTLDQVRQYLLHLLQGKSLSGHYAYQAVCAFRFFYRHTVTPTWSPEDIPYPKRPKHLPEILSKKEVCHFFEAVKPFYRPVFQLMYSGGFRLSEAISLETTDIDKERKVIRIRAGKGAKDREVPLARTLLPILRSHYLQTPKSAWLFRSKTHSSHVSDSTISHQCRLARAVCGTVKKITAHALRHTYAAHLIEAGIDLRTLQILLGHEKLKTTLRYAHVTAHRIQNVPSPLDLL